MSGNEAAGSTSSEETEFPYWVIKYTTSATVGALPKGFPYIIDEVSGEVCQVTLLFIRDKYLSRRGRDFNPNTVESYTCDLLDWMRYGARFPRPWNEATWDDLEKYVDSMEGDFISPHHGQSYSEKTISRRLVPILRMYKWAKEKYPEVSKGSRGNSLFEIKKVADFLDDRRKRKRSKVKVGRGPIADAELPNVMQAKEIKDTLAAIGPAPREPGCKEDEESAETSVGHLGMEMGLQAGLRVSEVAEMRVTLFRRFLTADIQPSGRYNIGPFRRKGGKFGCVIFHGVLLQKVVNYIKRERAFVLRGRPENHDVLLVHKKGCHKGLPIHKSTLQRRLSKACIAAGLTRSAEKVRPVDGDWTTTKAEVALHSAFTFHDLRHTYAVWMYYGRKANGDAEPWKYIQEQLGHEDVLTTMKTYLKVTQDFEAFVTDKFIATLNWAAGLDIAEAEAC